MAHDGPVTQVSQERKATPRRGPSPAGRARTPGWGPPGAKSQYLAPPRLTAPANRTTSQPNRPNGPDSRGSRGDRMRGTGQRAWANRKYRIESVDQSDRPTGPGQP